jgi:hypothetical protein
LSNITNLRTFRGSGGVHQPIEIIEFFKFELVEVIRIRTPQLIIKISYMILEVYCKEVIDLEKRQ